MKDEDGRRQRNLFDYGHEASKGMRMICSAVGDVRVENTHEVQEDGCTTILGRLIGRATCGG